MKTDNLKDHIAGALYGVAIGDALGAPLEFMSAKQIARKHGHVTEMIGGGWLDVRPGETTDDTAMTLAVAEGIMESPDDPIPAIGERFIRWAESGPKDIGGTCHRAIWKAATGGHKRPSAFQWENAGKETAVVNKGRSAGNGALMRAVYPRPLLPVGHDRSTRHNLAGTHDPRRCREHRGLSTLFRYGTLLNNRGEKRTKQHRRPDGENRRNPGAYKI